MSLLVLGCQMPSTPAIDLHALGFTGCALLPAIHAVGVAIPGTSGLESG